MALPQQLGRYVLERKLAAGGMAEVFLAKQSGPEGFEKICVVKRMLPHLTQEETFVSMFLDEARLAARLSHPNIAQIFDFGHADESYFLAMEYVPGTNLHDVIEDHAMRHMKLPVDVVVRIVALAATGLDFAHHATDDKGSPLNIIHRDISPHNIMLSKNGDVKLIDFGIAKASVGLHSTKVGTLKGKYAYMSPEQIRGFVIDKRTDIYAMGLVLYELLSGRPAIQGENESALMAAAAKRDFPAIESLRNDVPAKVRKVLERALSMNVADRYETAAQMADDLEDFLTANGTRVKGIEVAALLTPLAEITAVTMMPEPPVPSGTPTRAPTRATPDQTQSEAGSATLSDSEPSEPEAEVESEGSQTLRQPRELTSSRPTKPEHPIEVEPEPTSPQAAPLDMAPPRKFPLVIAFSAIALAGAVLGVTWAVTQSGGGETVLVAPPPPPRTTPTPDPTPVEREPVAATPTPTAKPTEEPTPEPTPVAKTPSPPRRLFPSLMRRRRRDAPPRRIRRSLPAPRPRRRLRRCRAKGQSPFACCPMQKCLARGKAWA